MMKTKKFDCVEMKRQGAEVVQREVAGMTTKEELAYWRAGTKVLRAMQANSREDKIDESS